MRFSIYLSFLKQTKYYIKWFLESFAFSWHWVTKQQLNFWPGFPGIRGSKYFLRRSSFFVWANIFWGGSLRGSKLFPWVQSFLSESTFIYLTRLSYYTTTNGFGSFFVNRFPTNFDQTLFDLFSLFKMEFLVTLLTR